MNAQDFLQLLRRLGACSEAVTWAKGKSLGEVWSTCERADWMLWLCGRMVGTDGWPTRQEVVLAACSCAETVLHHFEKKYPQDDRPRKAIEAARAWTSGNLDTESLYKARRAAYAAAYAAADAAAYAAYAAAAYAAAAYAAAARADTLRSLSKTVRELLTVPSEWVRS
ncbi:MAG TPA: hypothetical protein VGD60_00215 [Candidatus Acidoferrales bacterium]